jgi:hypothetical protein
MATRHVIARLSRRINALAAYAGRPVYVFGETRARAERAAAAYLAKQPREAGRPLFLVCWNGDEELWHRDT